MAVANNFIIGANDEHGLNPATPGKRTPIMPYINRSFYENEFNRQCKNDFIIALLRCGFNVFDVKEEITDVSVSVRVARINRQNLTYLVNFGYNAFGSGGGQRLCNTLTRSVQRRECHGCRYYRTRAGSAGRCNPGRIVQDKGTRAVYGLSDRAGLRSGD
jgi:hypothetical protein